MNPNLIVQNVQVLEDIRRLRFRIDFLMKLEKISRAEAVDIVRQDYETEVS